MGKCSARACCENLKNELDSVYEIEESSNNNKNHTPIITNKNKQTSIKSEIDINKFLGIYETGKKPPNMNNNVKSINLDLYNTDDKSDIYDYTKSDSSKITDKITGSSKSIFGKNLINF